MAQTMQAKNRSPEFKNQEQAQHIIGLLMRHMNDIARGAQSGTGPI